MTVSLKRWKSYAVSILIPLAVGMLSGWLTRDAMQSYEAVQKSSLTPPSAVFPIVWAILYILMGISAAIVWNTGGKDVSRALTIYGLQLAVNFLWSLLFFNLRAYLFSFLWLLLLLALILIMIFLFSKVNKKAAYLQIPYLLWVLFAGYLNYMVYLLNR